MLLFQSVRELLINSSKHSGQREAAVTLEERDGRLTIVVKDMGVGFDLAASTAAADASNGGLSSKFGLFSMGERMRALGGWFDIQSAPGRGTTATLSIPVPGDPRGAGKACESPASSIMDERPERTTRKKSSAIIQVLLVDDHATMRQELRSVLDSYDDVEVVGEAANGIEAVAAVAQLQPRIVIMDINMPKQNGIEATAEIKARYPDVTVIGLSVNADGNNQAAMLRAGASSFLTKEAAVDQLYDVIQQAVRQSSRQ